jgi:hypothetical protein
LAEGTTTGSSIGSEEPLLQLSQQPVKPAVKLKLANNAITNKELIFFTRTKVGFPFAGDKLKMKTMTSGGKRKLNCRPSYVRLAAGVIS